MLNLLRKTDDLSQHATIWYVPLSKLEDNPYQTRQRNDVDHVLNLAASIVQMAPSLPDTRGLQQLPVGRLVRYGDGYAYPADTYDDEDGVRALLAGNDLVIELAFGHSRRLAFLMLAKGVGHVFPELAGAEQVALSGLEYDAADYAAMPLLLRPLTDEEMWSHAITENAQRRDLTAIEEAIAIERARKEFGMTYDQAGKLFGKSRGAAANLVRLLQLPDKYQQAILDGRLTERHGRALLPAVQYPQLMTGRFGIEYAATLTAADLERQVTMWVRNHEIQLAEQDRKRLKPLNGTELIRLCRRFLDEVWGERRIPENPAHTNGIYWHEITRWLTVQYGATHRWYDDGLKYAIKQSVQYKRAELAQTAPPASPPQEDQSQAATYTPAVATDEQIAAAFDAWLREASPTDELLLELSQRWTWATLWWPMLTALKNHCNGAGITDHTLKVLLNQEIAKRQSDSATAQEIAEQEIVIFDPLRLMEWLTMFNETMTALGEWATECGHQAEAGVAARSLRAVLERIERDLGLG